MGIQIDDSVHCLCALMKIDLFYNQAQNEYLDMFIYGETVNENVDETNYDITISVICLILIIFLVCLIFGYWCYYYPKQQMKRNDAFWLGQVSGQNIESATLDNDEYHE